MLTDIELPANYYKGSNKIRGKYLLEVCLVRLIIVVFKFKN